MRSLFLGGIICALVLGLAVGASAEPYVAGYVGAAFPDDQDIVGENPQNLSFTDFKPEDSVFIGARGGYWFDGFPYIGIEGNVNVWFPDIDDQDNTRTSVSTTTGSVVNTTRRFKAEVDAISAALIGVVRYPIPNTGIVPYGGGGLGVAHVDFQKATIDGADIRADDDFFPVVTWEAGVKYYITPEIAVFAEYMYISKRFDTTIGRDATSSTSEALDSDVDTIEVDFDHNFVHGGIEYRFWDPFSQ